MNYSLNFSIDTATVQKPLEAIISVREFCQASDEQAIILAASGFVLAFVMLFYFGRMRTWIQQKTSLQFLMFLDKFFLTLNAFGYGIIFGRLLHAGY